MYRYMNALRSALRVVDTHNIDSVTMDRFASTLRSVPRRIYARITASRDWRAAMAWLERRNPKDWGRKARVVIGGEAKQPVVTVTITPEAADEEMLRRLAQMRRNLLASGRVVLRLVP